MQQFELEGSKLCKVRFIDLSCSVIQENKYKRVELTIRLHPFLKTSKGNNLETWWKIRNLVDSILLKKKKSWTVCIPLKDSMEML